jgi:hypothetical protein
MKRFVNGIEEHRWADFCQDMIERRDGKKYNKDCNYGHSLSDRAEFYNPHGGSTVHLRVEEILSGEFFEIRLLCADKRGSYYPIVALIDFGSYEGVYLFDCDGKSSDGLFKLHYESIYFEPGDYVVTTQDAIGIYANHWYMFASIEKDGTENLELNSIGRYKRPATEDEISKLNEMLFVHNKKWNNETKQLENI